MVRWLKGLLLITLAIGFTGCGSERCTGDNYYESEACPGYSAYGYTGGNTYGNGGSYYQPYSQQGGSYYDQSQYGNYGNYGSGYDDEYGY